LWGKTCGGRVISKVKGKGVPVLFLTEHKAMKAYWGVEIWLHAPAALPPGKEPLVPIG
jgi:hypothetical protein